MNIKNIFLLIVVLLFTTGCYGTLKGKVIDAETGKPIEGAVAMAEWTKTKGLGNTYTVSAKVVEAVSDKEGNVVLEGCWCPLANKPDLTIYKKGYVAWNNVLIFPDLKLREGFEWKSGQVFRLEMFKEGYSHDKHIDFIGRAINSSLNLEAKKNIYKAFSWEVEPARKERIEKKKSK